MSIIVNHHHHRRHQPSKASLINAAVQRLFDITCSHAFLGCWILFAQVRLCLLSPMASMFLMNLNLLWLAERSWGIQSANMHIWHPVAQLFFCVARMVHGAGVVLSAVLWIRIAMLCAGGC